MVVCDVLDGRITQEVHSSAPLGEKVVDALDTCSSVAPDVQGAGSKPLAGSEASHLSLWQRVQIFLMIQYDFLGTAEVTLIFYGFIPITLACWSLLRNGTKFEYIVAAKPG